MTIIKKYFATFKTVLHHLRDPLYESRLQKDLQRQGGQAWSPRDYYKTLDDDFFFWLMAFGSQTGLADEQMIPSLPPAYIQRRWTGCAGDPVLREGFEFFRLIREFAAQYSQPINAKTRIWDFGVGWGRILRFFMKDVEEGNLFGSDCYREALDICRKTLPRLNFIENDISPPVSFEKKSFDIIYLFSVFSHLSEESHLMWIQEFARCLKPNGLLIATTRSRQHILLLDKMRTKREKSQGLYQSTSAVEAFQNVADTLRQYDTGKFCFFPSGGGGPLTSSFYGEACIPEEYARTHWQEWFNIYRMRKADKRCCQNTFICVRR